MTPLDLLSPSAVLAVASDAAALGIRTGRVDSSDCPITPLTGTTS